MVVKLLTVRDPVLVLVEEDEAGIALTLTFGLQCASVCLLILIKVILTHIRNITVIAVGFAVIRNATHIAVIGANELYRCWCDDYLGGAELAFVGDGIEVTV